MRAALRTSRLLARPAWRTPRRGHASAARCVDASPKDAKRAAAAARRMEADAKTTAAELEARRASAESASPSPRALRNLTRLSAYATHGDSIKGFFEPGLLRLYLELDAVHESRGVRGALVEIGVFHGKSFMPLALLRQPGERCVAIDCFEDQSANTDRSGEGDAVAFRKNVDATMRACCDGGCDAREDWLAVLETDSRLLADDASPLWSAAAGSPVRLFSIDGCHTAEATAADLRVASNAMHPEGVVVLDDAFNPDWPGVVTGLFDWRRDVLETLAKKTFTANDVSRRGGPNDTLVADGIGVSSGWNDVGLEPFAIGFGKVFLCRPAVRDAYFARFKRVDEERGDAFGAGARKTAEFMSRMCAVFRHGWISTFHGNE
jgi:hypothetical protein